ncbi:MAG: KEOPS complex kinase/ATPase Bud32 [Candidatus Nanohaloarchaea archaeon]|nr:KEOPS complex kinase/ATPase Bud32 [Candidatus Nanohaloarchaea archaeon]
METIADGAEATLHRDDGSIVKERHEKDYRHPVLDERLRRERTEQEARLLAKAAQSGVRVPDAEQDGAFRVRMEEIDGTLLKDVFEQEEWTWPVIGESVARLHNRDIIHGDLTTSNMLVAGEEVYVIDFGLGSFSQRVEDRATDLHLLAEVLASTHTAVADAAMDRILDAYREHADDADAVLERYDEVAERGRYTG